MTAIEISFPQYPSYTFRVSAVRLVHEKDDINDAKVELFIDSVDNIGFYNISFSMVYYNNTIYHTDIVNNGVIEITKFDSINKIISGTFNFSTSDGNTSSPNVIQVTSGRFDLKE